MKEYFDAIAFLESLSNLQKTDYYNKIEAKTVYFNRMKYFLKLLGNPEKNLKFIHIGGTSGKGSTATMCYEILRNAGYKTAVYRSPHLTAFTERMEINGKFITAEKIVEYTEIIKKTLEKYLVTSPYDILSYPEIIFCMALLYFSEQKCDYVVVEVSCGGRCDLTNIIPSPKFTIITNIGHDHLHILGPRLTDVAREKAGIIKKGTVFFTTERKKRYIDIFKTECSQYNVKFNEAQKNYKILSQNTNGNSFIYKEKEYFVNLPGTHQIENATLAIEMAHTLKLSEKSIHKALNNIKFPGRFEIMQKKPLVILDSAHNLEKITSTVKTMENLVDMNKYRQKWLQFSFTEGKEIKPILNLLIKKFDKLIITRHTHTFRKACPPRVLIDIAKQINKNIEIKYFLDPNEATEFIMKKAKKQDLILITGSLYMAGQAREYWMKKEKIIKNRYYYNKK